MSPRRLTGAEEAELVAAARRAREAEHEARRLGTELDRLILELRNAGARVSDIAQVLGMSRTTVYEAINRSDGSRPLS